MKNIYLNNKGVPLRAPNRESTQLLSLEAPALRPGAPVGGAAESRGERSSSGTRVPRASSHVDPALQAIERVP